MYAVPPSSKTTPSPTRCVLPPLRLRAAGVPPTNAWSVGRRQSSRTRWQRRTTLRYRTSSSRKCWKSASRSKTMRSRSARYAMRLSHAHACVMSACTYAQTASLVAWARSPRRILVLGLHVYAATRAQLTRMRSATGGCRRWIRAWQGRHALASALQCPGRVPSSALCHRGLVKHIT